MHLGYIYIYKHTQTTIDFLFLGRFQYLDDKRRENLNVFRILQQMF